MASGNNSLKSGFKSCMEERIGDEDLVTWLQYPLEDASDKSYCSDMMDQWPQMFNMSRNPAPLTAEMNPSKPMSGITASMGHFANYNIDLGNASSFIRSKSPNSASMDMMTSSSGAKESRAVTGSMFRPVDAEGALAMGARRAAGSLGMSFGGFENLNRVKTSLQPQSSSGLGVSFSPSKAPSTYAPQNESPMKSCSMATMASASSNNTMASQPLHGSFKNIPNISWPMFKQVSIHPSEINLPKPSGSALPSPDSFKKSMEKHMPSPAPAQQQQSGCSHVTEEASIRNSSDRSNGATSKGHLCGTQPNSSMLQGVKTVFGGTQGQKMTYGGTVSEMAPASCSGGSQASADLIPKEPKRKAAEDSEWQSEDADGESQETKQLPKPKRNRAAEVHNLSERNRRNRINEKLKALQDLIPNSCKTDKASILDEAIEYMKTLQVQLQMVSMRNGLSTVSPMMIPVGMPQHLQMAPIQTVGLGVPIGHAGMGMGIGMGLGMGMGMGMNMGHMDFSNTVVGRPLQSVPASVTNFGRPFNDGNVAVSTQETSQTFSCTDSEVVQVPQHSSQLPIEQANPVSHSMLFSYLHEQNEQGQHIPNSSFDHGVGQ